MHSKMSHLVNVGNSKWNFWKKVSSLQPESEWSSHQSMHSSSLWLDCLHKNFNYLFSFVTGIAFPPGRNSCVINLPMKSSSTEKVSDKSDTSPASTTNRSLGEETVPFQPKINELTFISFDVSQTTVEFWIQRRQFVKGWIQNTMSLAQDLAQEKGCQGNVDSQTLQIINWYL